MDFGKENGGMAGAIHTKDYRRLRLYVFIKTSTQGIQHIIIIIPSTSFGRRNDFMSCVNQLTTIEPVVSTTVTILRTYLDQQCAEGQVGSLPLGHIAVMMECSNVLVECKI